MNLFEIGLLDDPYPAYAELRESGPLHHGDDGYWYITRYDDIQRLLRDASLVSGTGVIDSLGLTEGPLYEVMSTWLMALDGAAHARARRLVSSAFTPRAVEAMRVDIARVVDRALDVMLAAADDDGEVDLVPTVAFVVPMEVIRLLFAVPEDEWRESVTSSFAARLSPVAMMTQLIDYLSGLVDKRRAAAGDDLFSMMFRPDEAGERLSDEELVANGVLLITAGFETTMSLIANTVLTVFRRPEQAAAVQGAPGLASSTVEEVLRFETPALTTSRRTTVEAAVDGEFIPAHANVLFALASGNRDPRRYAEPDRFDAFRDDIRPLGFGGGVHACVGAALARLEAQLVLGRLVERFPGLRIDEDRLRWRKDNPTVRGPAVLVAHPR